MAVHYLMTVVSWTSLAAIRRGKMVVCSVWTVVMAPLPFSVTTNCSPDSPLSCATGDLTSKHGPLPFGGHRAVIHDPYLPLSGSDGVLSAVLLVQPANGVGDSVCVEVTMTTTISATPTPTPQTGLTSIATGPQTRGPSTTTSPPGSKRTGRLCVVIT